MFTKKIELLKKDEDTLRLCYINNNRVFITRINNVFTKYLFVPVDIQINKYNNFFSFSILKEEQKSNLITFLNSLIRFLKNNNKYYTKKLILKGLGFRITFLENKNLLRLKLGFSHLVDLFFPKDKIHIVVKKNVLHLKSYDPTFLGNFCNKIKRLRQPNVYNGKGFWYKNEKKDLKILKKK